MTKLIPLLLFALGTAGVAAAAPAATPRNYDCAKAGNSNKTVCKRATPAKVARAVPAKPAAKVVMATATRKVTTASVVRHYDCTKAGNKTKAQCRGTIVKTATVVRSVTAPRAVAAARPIARPMARPAAHAAAAPANTENRSAAGAIAQCKDGLFSHARRRDGACSRHGGVARWS